MNQVFQKCVEAGLIFQGIIEPPKKVDDNKQAPKEDQAKKKKSCIIL